MTIVRAHLIPSLGRIQLAKLTPHDVQAMLNDKAATGLSPRSVQYIRTVLRTALGQAEKWEYVPRNVAALVSGPRVEQREIQPLSPAQAGQLLQVAATDRLRTLYSVALALGMRQGEALGLLWEDIDLDDGTVHVRRTLQRVNGEYLFMEPKTARSRRLIAIPSVIVESFREHRRRQAEERLKVGPYWNQESDLVFTNELGGPLYGPWVTQHLQKLLAAAGLPRQRFHDLRHACASFLLAQGVADRVVMETLGHSQISTTMNIYSHVVADLKRDAARRMDDLLRISGA